MTSIQSRLQLAAAVMAFSSSAFAQQAAVSASNVSPVKALIPGAYARLELRHVTSSKFDAQQDMVSQVPQLQIRPTIGASFFDERVDTSFVWVFTRKAENAAIQRATLFNESKWNVLKGEAGDLGPYALIYQDHGNSYGEAYVGLDGNLTKTIKLGAGDLTFKGNFEPLALFRSAKTASTDKVEVRNGTGNSAFSLTGSGDTKIEQRTPTLYNATALEAGLKPSIAQKFYVGLGLELTQKWQPKYVARTEDGVTSADEDGYATSVQTTNLFKVRYKASDRISVAGTVRQNLAGYYEEGITTTKPDPTGGWANTRWETRLAVTADLL